MITAMNEVIEENLIDERILIQYQNIKGATMRNSK
jgi:hypothetical protein